MQSTTVRLAMQDLLFGEAHEVKSLSTPQTDVKDERFLNVRGNGGSEWGSNPPATGLPAARRF
ncbi:MAG TPA: hypothetical protein VKQ11_11385 [Candidatus Sulfotelmatobacter sp.]|nr:hypothetical protein [Candidatus Sulfotelmatobacter sp.]